MNRLTRLLVAQLLLVQSALAATLHFDNDGILTSATGVVVNSVSYDVQFLDGSCNSLFDDCNSAAYAFHTRDAAIDANAALQAQVFTSAFLDSGAVATGCDGVRNCSIWSPYDTHYASDNEAYARSVVFKFGVDWPQGAIGTGVFWAPISTSLFGNQTYAVWSVVPAPPAIWLLGTGLGLMGVIRRKLTS